MHLAYCKYYLSVSYLCYYILKKILPFLVDRIMIDFSFLSLHFCILFPPNCL